MIRLPITQRRWQILLLLALLWALYAVFTASFGYLQYGVMKKTVNWPRLLFVTFADCLTLLLLTWLLVELNTRFPFSAARWKLPVAIHSAAVLAGSVVRALVTVPIYQVLSDQMQTQLDFVGWFNLLFTAQFPGFLLIYWLLLGVLQALAYYEKFRERELEASILETQLAQAQLQLLKMQLHPHFLFNTLNAITALMHQDVDLADRMIARLGELLRTTLENAGTQEVPLKQELEFINPYLEIEQARLGPRLNVSFAIEPEAMDAQVPNLLLQPLVENAIRHGIGPRPVPGIIEIGAQREGESLTLTVRDNGPGLNGKHLNGKRGIGLQNTRARLKQLYGDNHRFEIANAPNGGLLATITIPFREAASTPSPRSDANANLADPHRG